MIVRRKRQTGGERCQSFSFMVEVGDPDVKHDMGLIFAHIFNPSPFLPSELDPQRETVSERQIVAMLTNIDTLPYIHNDVYSVLFPYGFFGRQTAEMIARYIIRRAVALELIKPCESAPGQYYFIAEKFKKRGRPPKDEK